MSLFCYYCVVYLWSCGELTLCGNFPSSPHCANANYSRYYKPLLVYSYTSLWVYSSVLNSKRRCWRSISNPHCVGVVQIIISISINTCIFTGNFKPSTRAIVLWWLYNGNQMELSDIQQWIFKYHCLPYLLLKSHHRT